MQKGEKILITGAKGQLGRELVKFFSQDHSYEIFPTDLDEIDISKKPCVNEKLKKVKPDVVVHCAAWTNVDAAAENPEAAMKVNGEGTKNICLSAKAVRAKVVYISSNEVFDGKKKSPYQEDDKPNPINSYGKSKLAGEQYCQGILGKDCMVVRSSWLYGPASKNNFPNKIITKAREQGFLKVVDDEIAVPTYTPDLAKAIKKLVEKNQSGTFHLVNKGQASRYEWARQILKEKNLKIPIKAVKLSDFKRPSTPPKYSALRNVRAGNLGVDLRVWKQANKEYLKNM